MNDAVPSGEECPACGGEAKPLAQGDVWRCQDCGEYFEPDDGDSLWDRSSHHRTYLREDDD